jgi:hypothetical protein
MENYGCARSLPNYSKFRFRSDQHRANGAPEGSVGYIVEVYDDAYEVEATEPETGETLFLGAVPQVRLLAWVWLHVRDKCLATSWQARPDRAARRPRSHQCWSLARTSWVVVEVVSKLGSFVAELRWKHASTRLGSRRPLPKTLVIAS